MGIELIGMLKRHEGVRSKVYMCSEGYETIGVGRNIAESGLGLSDDEIEYLLANDIRRVREELDETYFWFAALNEARKDAMIDISLDSRWSQQVGNRAVEVTEMIRTGEYQ